MDGMTVSPNAEAAALMARPALPRLPANADMADMRRVARDFEAVFLSQMLAPMFEGIENAPPFNGGEAEDMWRSLQVDEYGKAIANAGGVGIADAVLRQMIIMQEGS